jgi:hypothetical protein
MFISFVSINDKGNTYIRDKIATSARQTRTLEDIDDIIPSHSKVRKISLLSETDVHHNVHASQLRPHLKTAAKKNTTWVACFEQVNI